MSQLGDFAEDYSTLNFKFTTRTVAGVPAAFDVTSPIAAISVYKANGTTQSVAGITFTVDFDSVTGLHNVLIDLSADAFYAIGNDYQVVITTGTVNSVSVVGEVIAEFSIENRTTFPKADFPTNFAAMGIESDGDLTKVNTLDGHTAQTGDSFARIGVAGAGLTNIDLPNQTMDITGNLSGSVGSVTAINTTGGAIDDVVLVATTTTNTDMRGTDGANTTVPDAAGVAPTATQITADIDANSTALATIDTNIDSLLEGLILQVTTIATLASQTSFTLTAGSADDDAYDAATIVVVDASAAAQKAFGSLSDYTGSSLTVTLAQDPGIFTMAVGDKVYILPSDAFAIWDRILQGSTHNINNSAGKRLRQASAIVFSDGTAQSGGNNSIQLEAGAVTIDEEFSRTKVILVGGTGAGQEAIITSSVAATDTLTITPAWLVNPDSTTQYQVIPAQSHATVRNGGYDNGFVYVDTVNGTSGTEHGVHGTSTNPSDNLTDAYVVLGQENLSALLIEPGSSITLPSDSSNLRFEGSSYNVALNGQNIDNSRFEGASVSGIATADSGNPPAWILCGMGTVTLPPCNGNEVGFFGTFTLGSAGNYTFGGSAAVFDLSLIIDYGAALNSSQFYLQSYGGGEVEIQNAGAGTGTYKFQMNGTGNLTVNANCSATTEVTLRGNISRNADVAGITYFETANVWQDTINAEVLSLLTTQMTESYAANGVAPTFAQAQFAMHQMLMQFGIAGTSITVRQLDDSTTAFIVTMDDATNPTDAKRI